MLRYVLRRDGAKIAHLGRKCSTRTFEAVISGGTHGLFISGNGESTQDLLQVRQWAAEDISEGEEARYWSWEFPIRSHAKETRSILPRNFALLGFFVSADFSNILRSHNYQHLFILRY